MANHPHNSKRPAPRKVRKALEEGDIEALKLALTPRQRAFAREYVLDFNGAAAATRAGYAPTYADRAAYLLTMNPGVQALIDDLQTSKQARLVSVNPEYVIKSVTEIIHKEGARDGDKLRGLELLARHLGMFVDRTEISGPDGGAIEVENRRIEEEAQNFTSLMKAMKERTERGQISDNDKNDVKLV